MGEHTDKTKGKIKQAVGNLTGNKRLEREGIRDETKGRVEGAVNDTKDGAKRAVKSIKSAVHARSSGTRRPK